jgi:N-acetylmuramoyl-L-alanine amidase
MPAVLVEVGFIDSPKDNELLDAKFNEISMAIANGILETIEEPRETTVEPRKTTAVESNCPPPSTPSTPPPPLYRVQTGAFRNAKYANELLNRLLAQGYPAFILQINDLYKVQVGAFKNLENAIRMEARLRRDGYETFITT